MNIGIYGGSFNPIHFGHIGLVEWVIKHTDLDEIWLMVSPNNPLKDASILQDENERLETVRESINRLGAEGKGIIVSNFEFQLPRPTYTANTLRLLVEQYPQHTFTLIIGEDNLSIFHQWRDSEYILKTFRIFVYPRKGCPPYHIPIAKDLQVLQNAPYFDISSTEIRQSKLSTV
jgi:nicotinate-nucleotide adenylyltransferase